MGSICGSRAGPPVDTGAGSRPTREEQTSERFGVWSGAWLTCIAPPKEVPTLVSRRTTYADREHTDLETDVDDFDPAEEVVRMEARKKGFTEEQRAKDKRKQMEDELLDYDPTEELIFMQQRIKDNQNQRH